MAACKSIVPLRHGGTLNSRRAACPLERLMEGKESLHAEIVEVEIEVVSPSIVPSGNFAQLNRTVTCMVLKANDRRTSCPCHDEFRGPRSDYVRQVALATITTRL
ncbi:secernin-1 [Trichonephila clavipes]|nr:secernin-1 [Trichonephila clavipes]